MITIIIIMNNIFYIVYEFSIGTAKIDKLILGYLSYNLQTHT